MNAFANVLVLTGPTGSGKSALAVRLAERLGGEIVSMDSMALYRGMDIGTAKPDAEQRRRVPHHLLDVYDPSESASVAWWLAAAARCCQEISQRGRQPMLVGGTALYLKAILCGLFDGPPADPLLRRELEAEAASAGKSALHARLAEGDPITAARLHPNDVRRVIRALEVLHLTGQPISAWQTQWRDGGSPNEDRGLPNADRQASPIHWLDLPRAELHQRINERVLRMFAEGFLEECRELLQRPMSKEARQALGYQEAFAHLAGQATLAETIARIQARTRQFAKRQITWFRHLPGCVGWLPERIEEHYSLK